MSGPARGTLVFSSAAYDPCARAVHAVSQRVEGPTEEPLTLEQVKLRAGFVWADGDERDQMLTDFMKAAREKVEDDTGLALLTQTRTVYVDTIPTLLELPGQCSPLQSVESIVVRHADGTETTVPADTYLVDKVSNPARIVFTAPGGPPANVAALQAAAITVIAGWQTPADVPPLLVHAVGLLAAHWMTHGRDIVTVGTITQSLPFAYEFAISGFRPALVS